MQLPANTVEMAMRKRMTESLILFQQTCRKCKNLFNNTVNKFPYIMQLSKI